MRADLARHLDPDPDLALLQRVVDGAVLLFEAEASSIALLEPETDRLAFVVAAGAQGAGVVGLDVAPTQGIAGYVFSTGQPIALSDVGTDPRFDRATAERTGYVPRSIAAVPLLTDDGPIGVLQVLDKRTSTTFSLRDIELLGAFAGLASAAIEATRVRRDTVRLLRSAIGQLAPGTEVADVDAMVAAASRGLEQRNAAPFWRLVDELARIRQMDDRDVALVADLLDVIARHASSRTR